MAEPYLLLYDADRIRDFVFATGRLKDIRGASALVRDLTDPAPVRTLTGLSDWSPGAVEGLIYAGGAAGALLVAGRERALTLCETLEQHYRHRTGGAFLSAVAVPVAGMTPESQAVARRTALRALARRKAGRPHAGLYDGGIVRFCERDRLNPATVVLPDPDRSEGLLASAATAAKWRRSFVSRYEVEQHDYWKAFVRLLEERAKSAWQDALDAMQQRSVEELALPDMGDIGAQAEPRGYVAFVHIDGDGIGSAIDQVVRQQGFAGYAAISAALTSAAQQATGWALAAAYLDRPPRSFADAETGKTILTLPFEVLTIGGDDVILVCTADRGLQVACNLSRRFSDALAGELAQRGIILDSAPSASAGIVIAHDSLPMVQLQRRARELLRNAKRVRVPGIGGVDFHIVTTPSLDTLDRVRAGEYAIFDEIAGNAIRQSRPQTVLTRRPFTLLQAEILLQHARRLAPHLPRSKRADLYLASRSVRTQTTLDVLAVHTRLKPEARAMLIEALRDLDSVSHYPFGALDDDGAYHTALPDLLEAMEFVGEGNPS